MRIYLVAIHIHLGGHGRNFEMTLALSGLVYGNHRSPCAET